MASTKAAEPVSVPAGTLSRYVGTYDTLDDGDAHVVDVTVDSTSLYLDYDGNGKELLIPVSPTRFSWAGSMVEFMAGDNEGMNVEMHYVEGTERGTRRK